MENVDTLFTFCLIIAVSVAVIVAIRVVIASSPRIQGYFTKRSESRSE